MSDNEPKQERASPPFTAIIGENQSQQPPNSHLYRDPTDKATFALFRRSNDVGEPSRPVARSVRSPLPSPPRTVYGKDDNAYNNNRARDSSHVDISYDSRGSSYSEFECYDTPASQSRPCPPAAAKSKAAEQRRSPDYKREEFCARQHQHKLEYGERTGQQFFGAKEMAHDYSSRNDGPFADVRSPSSRRDHKSSGMSWEGDAKQVRSSAYDHK